MVNESTTAYEQATNGSYNMAADWIMHYYRLHMWKNFTAWTIRGKTSLPEQYVAKLHCLNNTWQTAMSEQCGANSNCLINTTSNRTWNDMWSMIDQCIIVNTTTICGQWINHSVLLEIQQRIYNDSPVTESWQIAMPDKCDVQSTWTDVVNESTAVCG